MDHNPLNKIRIFESTARFQKIKKVQSLKQIIVENSGRLHRNQVLKDNSISNAVLRKQLREQPSHSPWIERPACRDGPPLTTENLDLESSPTRVGLDVPKPLRQTICFMQNTGGVKCVLCYSTGTKLLGACLAFLADCALSPLPVLNFSCEHDCMC